MAAKQGRVEAVKHLMQIAAELQAKAKVRDRQNRKAADKDNKVTDEDERFNYKRHHSYLDVAILNGQRYV